MASSTAAVFRLAFPIGQDVDGDEVDRRDELGVIAPDAPDFTGRDRHLGLALDALDDLDQAATLMLFLERPVPARSLVALASLDDLELFRGE